MPMLFLCVMLDQLSEAVLPILFFWESHSKISSYPAVIIITVSSAMSQTSKREFYIEYDDQLLGVSIVCIWGGAGYYAMWLFELFVHTSFVTASSN